MRILPSGTCSISIPSTSAPGSHYLSLWQRFCMPEILGGKWPKFILAFECLSRFWTKHATAHILYSSYVQNLKKVHLLHPEPLHSSRNTTEIWSLIITPMMMVRKRRWRAFDWYVLLKFPYYTISRHKSQAYEIVATDLYNGNWRVGGPIIATFSAYNTMFLNCPYQGVRGDCNPGWDRYHLKWTLCR